MNTQDFRLEALEAQVHCKVSVECLSICSHYHINLSYCCVIILPKAKRRSALRVGGIATTVAIHVVQTIRAKWRVEPQTKMHGNTPLYPAD